MKKKLKIKFWKAEKALAMQILEQEGLPEIKEGGKAIIAGHPDLYPDFICLQGDNFKRNYYVATILFEDNRERDIYLDKTIKAITDELFTSGGELKIGDMCEVASCPDVADGYWHKKKLIAILPENYRSRFITQRDDDANNWFAYKYARAICKRVEPKIEECGDVITYTWEEE